MALYREYKNGIYGRRYKKLYIVKEEGGYCIYKDKDVLATDEKFVEMSEAEWWIDKEVASEEELELMRALYDKEIYILSDLMFRYMEVKNTKGLSKAQKNEYELIATIRGRKAKDKAF